MSEPTIQSQSWQCEFDSSHHPKNHWLSLRRTQYHHDCDCRITQTFIAHLLKVQWERKAAQSSVWVLLFFCLYLIGSWVKEERDRMHIYYVSKQYEEFVDSHEKPWLSYRFRCIRRWHPTKLDTQECHCWGWQTTRYALAELCVNLRCTEQSHTYAHTHAHALAHTQRRAIKQIIRLDSWV